MRASAIAGLVISMLLRSAALQAQSSGTCWSGEYGVGPAARRMMASMPAASDSTAALHFLNRSIDTHHATLSVTGDSVRMIGTQDTTLLVRLGARGDSLTGTLRVRGNVLPVRLHAYKERPRSARLPGYWSGALYTDTIAATRIALRIVEAPCGTLWITMDAIDQGRPGLAITSLDASGDSLRFGLSYLDAEFTGALVDGEHLVGAWTQHGVALNVRLTRAEPPVSVRSQIPRPPLPYSEQEVLFHSSATGLRYSGALTLPPGGTRVPTVILISGSGAQDRNQTVFGHPTFLVLADHLTRNGFGVLRLDDRGVGRSEGSVGSATLDDRAADVRAALDWLWRQPGVDTTRVGLLGHSEGGRVAPRVAVDNDSIAFVILLGSPADHGEAVILRQAADLARSEGMPEELVDAGVEFARRIIAILRSTTSDTVAARRIRATVDSVYAFAGETVLRAVRTGTEARLERGLSASYRSFMDDDPAERLTRLRQPILVLYGERDVQVPPDNADRMRLLVRDNRRADVRVLAQLNHLFQTARTGAMSEYASLEESFAPAALETIATWLKAVTAR